jgi:hypothetical protein
MMFTHKQNELTFLIVLLCYVTQCFVNFLGKGTCSHLGASSYECVCVYIYIWVWSALFRQTCVFLPHRNMRYSYSCLESKTEWRVGGWREKRPSFSCKAMLSSASNAHIAAMNGTLCRVFKNHMHHIRFS